MFPACQPIVPMTTTVGAFNLKSLSSLCSYVQVLNSILFFDKLLQSLLTTKAQRSKEIFIIVLFKSLLCKRKNAAMNCHKLTHMLHHCMYVWCYIIIMVHINEVANPLLCTLFKLVNYRCRQCFSWL